MSALSGLNCFCRLLLPRPHGRGYCMTVLRAYATPASVVLIIKVKNLDEELMWYFLT